MTDKQAVLEALQRLPENASLEEIIEELRVIVSLRHGRADAIAGRTGKQRDMRDLLKSWATERASK
jgi:hypothetical protein